MRVLGPFDVTAGAFPVPCGGREATGTLVLKNLSGYELAIRAGGLSDIIGAHTYERIDVGSLVSWDGNLQVTPQALASNTSQAPSQVLIVTAYAPGEPVSGYYPIAIDRLSNVGNTVATTGSTSLKNDGNSPGTQLLESTPSDQGASAINLANDGSGFWQVLSAGVQRIVANVTRGNAGAGKAIVVIGDAGDTSITTLHGTADKATNATNALNTGDGASGGYITAADSGTALDIHPIVGANRMLNLSMRDTGGVLRSILRTSSSGATTFLDSVGIQFAGKFTAYNGFTATGLGMSFIVAQAMDVPVTSTALQTILSYTPTAVGPYRVTIAIQLNNNVSGNKITAVLNWTDRTLGAGSTDSITFTSPNTGGVSPIALSGATSILNGGVIAFPMTVMLAANQPMSVQYQDPTNTPNDLVSVIIERMA